MWIFCRRMRKPPSCRQRCVENNLSSKKYKKRGIFPVASRWQNFKSRYSLLSSTSPGNPHNSLPPPGGDQRRRLRRPPKHLMPISPAAAVAPLPYPKPDLVAPPFFPLFSLRYWCSRPPHGMGESLRRNDPYPYGEKTKSLSPSWCKSLGKGSVLPNDFNRVGGDVIICFFT